MTDLITRVDSRCFVVGMLLLLLPATATAEYTILDDETPSAGMSMPLQLIVLMRGRGERDRALTELDALLQEDPAEPTRLHASYLRARYRLEQVAAETNADDADWEGLRETISTLAEEYPEDAGIAILRLETDLARPDSLAEGQVASELLALETQFSESPKFWRSAFVLYTRLGRPQRAEDALARFDAAMDPDNLAGREGYAGATDRQRESAKNLLADRYDDIKGHLSRVKDDLGSRDIDAAILSLNAWIAEHPHSVQPRMMLMGVLVAERRPEELGKLEQELSTLNGAFGAIELQARVQRLLLMAENGDAGAADEASKTLDDWLSHQPWQAAAHASAGTLAEILGEFDEAIESYRSAIRYGNRDPNLIHSLLSLLLLSEEPDGMVEIASELGRHELLTVEVLPLVVHAHLLLDEAEAGVSLAKRGIVSMPNESDMHVAMAMAMLGSSQDDRLMRAKESLDRARELAPASPARWAASLWISLQQDRIDTQDIARLAHRAGALLNAYDDAPRDAWKSVAAAHCLELMGEVSLAEPYYQTAIYEAPGSSIQRWIPRGSAVPRATQSQGADPPLESMLFDVLDQPIQQTLALIECYAEGSGLPQEGPLNGDPRLEAIALLSSDSAALRQQAALRLATIPDDLATASDHLLAARISRFHAPRSEVSSHLRAALDSSPSQTELLEITDDALGSHDPELAAEAIAMLREQDEQAALVSELKLMLMMQQPDKARALAAESITGDPSDRTVALTRQLANLFAESGQLAIALELLDTNFSESPAYDLVRTEVLGSAPDGRQEAMTLCLALAEQGQDYLAAILAIRTAEKALPNQEFADETDELIDRLAPETKDSASFLAYLFRYRELQGRINDAQRVAETAVAIDNSSFAQRNNRAWILAAYRDRAAEALTDVNRAIRDAGPREDLLDTKAVSLIKEGRPKSAAMLLEPLVATLSDSPTSVSHALHLFESLRKSETDANSVVLREWVEPRFDNAVLGPFDRAALKDLLEGDERSRQQ